MLLCGLFLIIFSPIFSHTVWGDVYQEKLKNPQSKECLSPRACFESQHFTEVVAQFPDSLWAERSKFLIGSQLIKNGSSEGRLLLEGLSERLPLVADYIQWAVANSFFIQKEFKKSAFEYEAISRLFPDTPLRTHAQYLEGVSWFKYGNCILAKSSFALLFNREPGEYVGDDSFRASSGLYLSDCHLKEGNRSLAVRILWRIWADMPHFLREEDMLHAHNAFQNLGITVERATRDQLWRRGTAFFDSGKYLDAADVFMEYLHARELDNDVRRVDGLIKLGIALVKTRQLDKAKAVFESVIKKHSALASPEAYLWLARTYLRLGAGEDLKSLSKQIETLSLPQSVYGSIMYFLGLWYEDHQNLESARDAYQRAVEEIPEDPSASWVYSVFWQLAWTHFLQENYTAAIDAFDHMIQYPTKNDVQRVLYWKAVALKRLGRDQASGELFYNICREFPYGYYCQNTSLKLKEAYSHTINLPKFPPTAATSTVFDRVTEMIYLGLSDDAIKVLNSIDNKSLGIVDEYLFFSRQLQVGGDVYRSLKLVKTRFDSIIRGDDGTVPLWFWELAYPRVHMPIIAGWIQQLQADEIDPYLISALIREESAFNASARSSAGAVGLMQIVPKTAFDIAKSLEIQSFNEKMLLDPSLNIQFGAWYFRSLLNRFNGNLVSAIAAYNAGPTAVARWRGATRGETSSDGRSTLHEEEFIESIPYEETRKYVKRVLQVYREYRRVFQAD